MLNQITSPRASNHPPENAYRIADGVSSAHSPFLGGGREARTRPGGVSGGLRMSAAGSIATCRFRCHCTRPTKKTQFARGSKQSRTIVYATR